MTSLMQRIFGKHDMYKTEQGLEMLHSMGVKDSQINLPYLDGDKDSYHETWFEDITVEQRREGIGVKGRYVIVNKTDHIGKDGDWKPSKGAIPFDFYIRV